MISSVWETICNAKLGLVGEQRQKSKKWGGAFSTTEYPFPGLELLMENVETLGMITTGYATLRVFHGGITNLK